MNRALILVSIVLLFACCEGTHYRKDSYTKTRVKRIVSNDLKNNNKEAVPGKEDSLSVSDSDILFHIIVASSTSKNTALDIARYYKNKGCNTRLIQSKNRFRVSVDAFKTKEEAIKAKTRYTSKLNKKGIWILPF